MFENELQDLRRHKWRVDTPTRAVFTADDAREFLHNVGFCLEYPLRAQVLAPTFIGAVIGSDENLPTAKYAFIHPRAKEATEFKDRLLREKSIFEAGFGDDDNLLISALEFPYFYALIGDRNPKVPPSAGERGERRLLTHAFELIQQHGPILETDLRERLGETVSDVALSRTLSELRQMLRIVRIEDSGGAKWDLLMRWAPQVVNQGKQISAQEALSALVSKYLEMCVAADQREVEEFFGYLVPRSRVTEVIKALLSAREFGFIQVSEKNLLRNTPRLSAEEKAAQIAAAAAPKPAGRANRSFQPRPEGEEPKPNVWEKYGPKKDKKFDRPGKFDRAKDDRPWKKAEGDARPPGRSGGKRFDRPVGGEWKKPGPKRPWQKPDEATTGEAGERAPRSFSGGMRPPRKFDGPRPERKFDGPRAEWEKRPSGPGGFKKPAFGGKKPAFGAKKPAFGAKKSWPKKESSEGAASERPFSDRPKRKFDGPRPDWKKRADGQRGVTKDRPKRKFDGPRPDWKKRADGPGDAPKDRPKRAFSGKPSFGKPSFGKPSFRKSAKKDGGQPPPRAADGARSDRPYKKSSAAGGFKKPFKKPFKRSARPGGFAKPRTRRPE